MSWVSSWWNSFTAWWKKHNSIGDIVRANETLVRQGVASLVDFGWDKKEQGEIIAEECAIQLINHVLAPLPDMVEALVGSYLQPKVASFFHSAFTLPGITTKDEAVSYVQRNLEAIK